MFGLAYPFGQGIRGVVGQHGYMGLHDGRAAVEFFGNEVYGGAVLATATAQVAACAIVTAILTPLVTSWCYKHFEGQGHGDSKKAAADRVTAAA